MSDGYTGANRSAVRRYAKAMLLDGRDLERGMITADQFGKRAAQNQLTIRRLAQCEPVPLDGDRNYGWRTGYFQAELRDGTRGYFQRRVDDCLQAAIASCAQIPMPLVPDLQIDRQRALGREPEEIERVITQKLIAWTEANGLTIMFHPTVPTTGRWIGVVPDERGPYLDHCLLMNGRDVLFDPASVLPAGDDERASPAGLDFFYCEHAITIERR